VQTLSANQVAVVFGPEDTGLTNTDLRYCHQLVTIPTASTFSSLNLAQAVLVCCYEIFLVAQKSQTSPQAQIPDLGLALDQPAAADLADDWFSDDVAEPSRILAVAERQEFMYDKLQQALLSVGFLHRDNPEHIMFALRRMLGRAGLEERDVRILLGLAHQIAWYAQSGWQLQSGQPPRQKGQREGLDYPKPNSPD
jgi:tRNA/rRNA methyltransferase